MPEEEVIAALRPWAWGGTLDVLVTQSLGAARGVQVDESGQEKAQQPLRYTAMLRRHYLTTEKHHQHTQTPMPEPRQQTV